MAAQKLIRNIPDEDLAVLEQKAQAAGMNAEEYIRGLIHRDVSTPIVRERYAYRFYGPGDARGIVRRLSNDLNGIGGGLNGATREQADAVRLAQDLMRRNEPGDQLKAYDLLKAHFEEVVEVPAI